MPLKAWKNKAIFAVTLERSHGQDPCRTEMFWRNIATAEASEVTLTCEISAVACGVQQVSGLHPTNLYTVSSGSPRLSAALPI